MDTDNSQRFAECFDAIHQFLGILDEVGRVMQANRAALEYTGLTQSEVAQAPLWSIPWAALSRQNRLALKQAVDQAASGAASHKEIEIRRRGQPKAYIDFTIQPVASQGGAPPFLLAEGRDVTAYRRASEALFQSEARFKTIFEEAGVGIVIKGMNGRMLDCNPAFQAMVGYSAAELRRRDYLDITHPLDKRTSRKLFTELANGLRKNYSIEKRYIHKNGETVWGRMTASLVHGQDGELKFVIGMVENITASKQIEAELTELQQRLMQGREMERLRLAQDLHDGPLQEIIAVSYQVQDLENSIREEAGLEQLQAIRTALAQLTRSVRAICGELRPPTLAPFGLEKTILSHLEQFQAAHPELTIRQKLAHDGRSLPENVRIVLFRIYQEALNNILRHAQATSIKIRFRLAHQEAILEIQDDGVGFELPKRWVKLARQGHLGLVGAIERASEVGGTLEVTSAPGQGTLIKAVVPLNKEDTLKEGAK